MYSVYVLRSLANLKRYVGYTGRSLNYRLNEHNEGSVKSTRKNRPYQLVHVEEYENKKDALKRERFLKSGQGRKILDQLLNKQLF